jgi:hypothetical protein
MSKNIELTPRKNFTTLNPSPSPKKLQVPISIYFFHVSMICCTIEREPPVKSRMMFARDHPYVDFQT